MNRNTFPTKSAAKLAIIFALWALFWVAPRPVLWVVVISAGVALARDWRSIAADMRGDQ